MLVSFDLVDSSDHLEVRMLNRNCIRMYVVLQFHFTAATAMNVLILNSFIPDSLPMRTQQLSHKDDLSAIVTGTIISSASMNVSSSDYASVFMKRIESWADH